MYFQPLVYVCTYYKYYIITFVISPSESKSSWRMIFFTLITEVRYQREE